jgi:hypothetical protein
MNLAPDDEVGVASKWLMLTFILIGLVLILVSFAIPHEGVWNYFRDIFRELGVVASSVFTVSLLYERLIAKKHIQQFLSLLRDLIEQGESNAGTCARLGIIKIFYSRDAFEREFPLADLLRPAAQVNLRVVAQTAFLLMNRAVALKAAIQEGAAVELCIFDPSSLPEDCRKNPDLLVSDIQSAVSVFETQIASWARTEKPKGKVELRYHQVPIFDSLLVVESPNQSLAVWDLGFGRDVTEKRTLLVDPAKAFGKGLTRRYGYVWNNAKTVFRYDGQQVSVDALSNSDLAIPLDHQSVAAANFKRE